MIFFAAFFLGGCAKKTDLTPTVVSEVPIVPSPDAPFYAVGESQAKDPLVAQVVSDLPWDESLSGAAGSIGLNFSQDVGLPQARWAAILAGYPYEVNQLTVGPQERGVYPTGLQESLRSQQGDHLGVARVRTGDSDIWVALSGAGGPVISTFAREFTTGERLKIEGDDFAWRLLDPDGEIHTGSSPVRFDLSIAGEWWVELISNDRVFVSVPVYVDIKTPVHNLFSHVADRQLPSKEYVLRLINEMRVAEDLPVFTEDKTLLTLALEPLLQLENRTWNRKKGEQRLRDIGFVEAYQFGCIAFSVEECLDEVSWTIAGRNAFLNPDIVLMGLSMKSIDDKFLLIFNLASDE